MRLHVFLAAAAAGLLAGGAAIAAPPSAGEVTVHAPDKGSFAREREHKAQAVKYGDLNLASSDGARTLMDRLSTATRAVCLPEPDRKVIADVQDHQDCRRKAMQWAVQDVGHPNLTKVYQTARK